MCQQWFFTTILFLYKKNFAAAIFNIRKEKHKKKKTSSFSFLVAQDYMNST